MKKITIFSTVFLVLFQISFSSTITLDQYKEFKTSAMNSNEQERQDMIKRFRFSKEKFDEVLFEGVTALNLEKGLFKIRPVLWKEMQNDSKQMLLAFSMARILYERDPGFKIVKYSDPDYVFCEIDNNKFSFYSHLDTKGQTLSNNGVNKNNSSNYSFSGSGQKETRSFTVSNPWTLKYNNKGSILQVYLYNDSGTLKNIIVNTLSKGEGDTYIRSTGTFYFSVNSISDWELEVIED